jgi:uncharacterized delta-60 repeat protein
MKNSISILLSLLLISLSFSQDLTQQWVARYNGTANSVDWASGLVLDNTGNVYVTGYGNYTGRGKDYTTVKYGPDGNQIWMKTYNGEVNGGDYSFAIAVDNQNNIYVTGRSDRGVPTYSDITTIKYNSSGTQLWVAHYDAGFNGLDEACCIAVDDFGNVVVSGKTYRTPTNPDMVVVKYNTNGVEQWSNVYNGIANSIDLSYSVTFDPSGNVIICGVSVGAGSGSDFTTIKYNSAGVQQWVNRYNGPDNMSDFAQVVKADAWGNIYVTGVTEAASTSYDYMTVKYNSTGAQQWLKIYNGLGNLGDFVSSMTIDDAGNIYVTGKSVGTVSTVDSNYATIKYSPDGTQNWVAVYTGSTNSNDVARAITIDAAGNVYVTGGSSGVGMNDYATVKYSPSGVMLWVIKYNGPANNDDFTSSIAVDALGSVYVTGKSKGINSDYDYATVKYANPLGIINNGTEIPAGYLLNQNYPNPFNPSTVISFGLPKETDVKLSVFNTGGEELAGIFNGRLAAGNYNFTFDGIGLSSGVYFYRLETKEFTQTKKMILIK